MNEAFLEKIELRLLACEGTPWGVADFWDGSMFLNKAAISRASEKEVRKTLRKAQREGGLNEEAKYDVATLHKLVLFRRMNASEEEGDFISHAPQDMRALIDEVRRLQHIVDQDSRKGGSLTADLKNERSERKRLEDQISLLKRAWRDIQNTLGRTQVLQ